MKRILILVAMLLLISTLAAGEAVPTQVPFPFGEPLDIAYSDDINRFALAVGNKIVIAEPDGAELCSFERESAWYSSLCWGEGDVWAYDENAHALDVVRLAAGSVERAIPIPEEIRTVNDVSVSESGVVILGERMQGGMDLWVIDPAGGRLSALGCGDVSAFALAPNGNILAYRDAFMGCVIEEYDINSMKKEKSYPAPPQISAFQADAHDEVYFLSHTALYRGNFASLNQASLMAICRIENRYARPVVCLSPSDAYVWYVTDTAMTRIPKSYQTNIGHITMLGDFYEDSALRLFENENLDVHIAFEAYEDFSIDQILTFMRSQDSSFDLFLLNSSYWNARAIIEKGYFVDLYQSDVIRDSAKQWFGNLRSASEQEGKLFGYPVFLYGQALRVDERVRLELDVLPATGGTWTQFYDRLSRANGLKSLGYLARTNLQQDVVVSEFLRAVAQGDGELSLGELVAQMLHAQNPGMDAVYFTTDDQVIENTAALYKLDYFDTSSPFLPMPSLGGKMTVPISVGWIVVNPYSKNLPKAIEYVEAYARAMDMGLIYAICLGKDQVYQEDFDPALIQMSDALQPYYAVKWGPDFELFSRIEQEIARYNENPPAFEQCVGRIASIVQMYLEENKS